MTPSARALRITTRSTRATNSFRRTQVPASGPEAGTDWTIIERQQYARFSIFDFRASKFDRRLVDPYRHGLRQMTPDGVRYGEVDGVVGDGGRRPGDRAAAVHRQPGRQRAARDGERVWRGSAADVERETARHIDREVGDALREVGDVTGSECVRRQRAEENCDSK